MPDRVIPQKRPAAAPIGTRSPASLDGMGRSQAALTGALIGAVISGALIDLARGGDRVECEPQRVTGDGHYWAYRIIDGRECWYPGRPGKPKNELYWGRGTTLSARQTVDQPQAEACPPSRPPASWLRHRRNRSWTSPRPRPRPCPLSPPPASWLRHRRNRRSPRQCRRNGARPPPTSCLRSPAAGRSWRSLLGRRLGRWPCYRSGSTCCGGLPSQDENYGLFVPEMLAE